MAQARGEIRVGVFEDLDHLVAQIRRPFAEDNAALQQESANLVDAGGAATYALSLLTLPWILLPSIESADTQSALPRGE